MKKLASSQGEKQNSSPLKAMVYAMILATGSLQIVADSGQVPLTQAEQFDIAMAIDNQVDEIDTSASFINVGRFVLELVAGTALDQLARNELTAADIEKIVDEAFTNDKLEGIKDATRSVLLDIRDIGLDQVQDVKDRISAVNQEVGKFRKDSELYESINYKLGQPFHLLAAIKVALIHKLSEVEMELEDRHIPNWMETAHELHARLVDFESKFHKFVNDKFRPRVVSEDAPCNLCLGYHGIVEENRNGNWKVVYKSKRTLDSREAQRWANAEYPRIVAAFSETIYDQYLGSKYVEVKNELRQIADSFLAIRNMNASYNDDQLLVKGFAFVRNSCMRAKLSTRTNGNFVEVYAVALPGDKSRYCFPVLTKYRLDLNKRLDSEGLNAIYARNANGQEWVRIYPAQ